MACYLYVDGCNFRLNAFANLYCVLTEFNPHPQGTTYSGPDGRRPPDMGQIPSHPSQALRRHPRKLGVVAGWRVSSQCRLRCE